MDPRPLPTVGPALVAAPVTASRPQPKGVTVAEGREVAVLKAAKSAGAQVIWALAGLALCGAAGYTLINKGPPEVNVSATDRWTGSDQIRFETINNERIAKMERVIERMDILLLAQSKTTDRILSMIERQEERLRALENRK